MYCSTVDDWEASQESRTIVSSSSPLNRGRDADEQETLTAEPSQAARCRFGDESVSELTGWVRMYHSHHTSVQLKLQERASVNSGKAFA